MKNLQFIIIALLSLVIVSCSNNENTAGSTETVSSPFTVKYEIVANSNMISPGSNVIV